MKRILRMGAPCALIVLLAFSTVFATMSGFQPLADKKSVVITQKCDAYLTNPVKGQFTKELDKSGAIIPKDPLYNRQVEATKDKNHSKKGGEIMSNKDVKNTAGTIKNGINNSYWFDMKKGQKQKPWVRYTGYRIWDPDLGRYVNLTIDYKVIDWNRKYRASNNKKNPKNDGKFRATIGISKTFNGIPYIDIVNLGTVKIEITFMDADHGNAKYSPKFSLNYDDIDCWQGIGVAVGNSGGFTIHEKGVGNLRLSKNYEHNGEYFHVISSNTPDTVKEKKGGDPSYMASFNIDTSNDGTVQLVYLSNQKKDSNTMDAPNGRHSLFNARNFKQEDVLPPPTPSKMVLDEGTGDDVDNKSGYTGGKLTHNTVAGISASAKNHEFFYVIKVKIPPNGSNASDSTAKYTRFVITDKIDSCITADTGNTGYKWTASSVARIKAAGLDAGLKAGDTGEKIYYRWIGDDKKGHAKDVTSAFTKSGNDWSLKTNNSLANTIYNGGKSGDIYLVIPCHFNKKAEDMVSHHSAFASTNYVDVNNQASVTVKIYGAAAAITKSTNTVKTRIRKKIEKELIIKKNVTGEKPETDRPFHFTLSLNNGGTYSGYILHADSSREEFTDFQRSKTFDLKHDEELHLLALPNEVTYEISEKQENGYTASYTRTGDGASGSASGSAIASSPLKISGETLSTGSNTITYTVTNTRTLFKHDLIINKKVLGNSTNNYTVRVHFYGSHVDLANLYNNTTVSSSVTKSVNGDAIEFSGIGNGSRVVIGQVPDDAGYVIEEVGKAGVKPQFKVISGQDAVEHTSGSAARGESLQTERETFVPGSTVGLADDYDVEYRIVNNTRGSHDVEVTKESTGEEADPDDEFKFTAAFSSIPTNEDNGYDRFVARITEGSTVVKKIAGASYTTNSYTQSFKLKAGQKITFYNVPEGTQLNVTEQGNDYRPRVTYTNSTGQDATLQGEQYTNLSATTVLGANDLLYTFAFNNTRERDPYNNQLKVGKVATDGTSNPFQFTANLEGLTASKWYAAASTYGNTEYELVQDSTGIYVKNKDNNQKIAGVAFTLTRPDGKKKTFTANASGLLPKSEYGPWADVDVGNLDIDWVGGHYSGIKQKYAVYDEDEKTLTFIESAETHTNGEYDGSKTYYAGFEDITGDANPPWYPRRTGVRKVVFKTTISPKSCYNWFCQMMKLTEIEGLDLLDTSAVTTMESMFFACESLEAVDVTGFDTHNVTNMDQMFGDCASFTSLDLSGFDTGNVSKMSFMFRDCPKLQRIYVSDKWDVSGVTSSSSMFSDCPELPNYDASYHDKTKAYYGGDGLGYLTYRPYTNNSGSGSQGASGNDQEPPEDENTGTYFTGTITPFQADGSGNASPSFLNASDDTTTFDGLPEGASYVITETACGYKPSYAVYKNEEIAEQKDGKKDEALSTERGEFSLEGDQNDYVEYVNTKNSFNLEVGKTTIGDTNKKFDFTINLSGLHEEEYTARISGNKTAGISMNADGDIAVTVVTGSAEGLPVKLIRPYDWNSKTLYTDAQGKISADKFVSWLSKGQKKAYDFTVQWNGGETTGRFMIPE